MYYKVDKETFKKLSDEDKKIIEDSCEYSEMKNKSNSEDDMDNIKDFDEAADKGIALIIEVGKNKSKEKDKK